jgi:hypothetical protein
MIGEFLSGPYSIAMAFFLFFLMTWSGYALLHLVGLGSNRWPCAIFAGPAVIVALWTIVLSGAVWALVPLNLIAIPTWALTISLAAIGLGLRLSVRGHSAETGDYDHLWSAVAVVAAALIPLLIMPATFRYGLANFGNSTYPDSWSYVAVADTLMTVTRTADGGLPALHQYAAHLGASRNSAYALLAFLSFGLGGIKPDQVVVLFCLCLLFANAVALIAFAGTAFGRVGPAMIGLVLLAGLGWPADIVATGNFDHLLLLPLMPSVAALALIAGGDPATRDANLLGASLVIGAFAAAAMYAYPELAFFGFLTAISFFVVPNTTLRLRVRRAILLACIALPVAALLIRPGFSDLLIALKGQFGLATSTNRPGDGFFPGILSRLHVAEAVWALGREYLISRWPGVAAAIAVVLAITTATGVWSERRRWSVVLALCATTAAFIHFAYRARYDYAVYKIVSVNFWMISFFTIAGWIWLAKRANANRQFQVGVVIAPVLALIVITTIRTLVQITRTDFNRNARQQQNFREATKIAAIIGKEPTVLAVHDPLANQWGVFYLTTTPILVAPYRMYMAQLHVIPFMERATPVEPAAIQYIVTDRNDKRRAIVSGARRIWDGEVYSLWNIEQPDWSVIADVNNPNGNKSDALDYWTWLGSQAAEFLVVMPRASHARLVGKFYPGPRAPTGPDGIRLEVNDTSGRHEIVVREISAIVPLVLSAGKTSITIKIADQPGGDLSSRGDARIAMVRLTNFTIASDVPKP